MNHNPDLDLVGMLAGPDAPRAALVWLDGDKLAAKPVLNGTSLINLDTNLTDHLSAEPRSDEYLVNLRDYCQARLDARTEALRSRGIAVPGAGKTWAVMPRPGLQRVEVH